MHVWLIWLGSSAFIGALCAIFIKKAWAIYMAGGLPWLGLLSALIYTVYFAPGHDGGDGFWIIAQLVGGTIAAITGMLSFRGIREFLSELENKNGNEH